jgi:hypothetical protein
VEASGLQYGLEYLFGKSLAAFFPRMSAFIRGFSLPLRADHARHPAPDDEQQESQGGQLTLDSV